MFFSYLQDNLKSKAISSIKWSALDRLSSSLIQFAIGIIIARLLLPSDYGLVGMITVFIAFSQSLIDGGFSAALIQKKNPENKDFTTIFYFNVLMGVLLYLLLFFASPFIADFYNEIIKYDINRLNISEISLFLDKTDLNHENIDDFIKMLLEYFPFATIKNEEETLSSLYFKFLSDKICK